MLVFILPGPSLPEKKPVGKPDLICHWVSEDHAMLISSYMSWFGFNWLEIHVDVLSSRDALALVSLCLNLSHTL